MPSNLRFMNPSAIAKPGGYSHVVEATGPGRIVYIAGQLGLKPGDTEISGGIAEQTEQVFANLKAILEQAGTGLGRSGRADEDAVVRHEHRAADAEVRHAGVVRHPVQPGAERVGLGAAAQRGDGEDEDLLLDVLGLLRRAQERAAVAQDRR